LANPQAIQKAQSAKALSQTLEEPFKILEASYFEQIIESASDDSELREYIYHRIRVMKDLKIVLTKIVADGQIAEADIVRIGKIESGELKEFY